jgi:hypothetical protein
MKGEKSRAFKPFDGFRRHEIPGLSDSLFAATPLRLYPCLPFDSNTRSPAERLPFSPMPHSRQQQKLRRIVIDTLKTTYTEVLHFTTHSTEPGFNGFKPKIRRPRDFFVALRSVSIHFVQTSGKVLLLLLVLLQQNFECGTQHIRNVAPVIPALDQVSDVYSIHVSFDTLSPVFEHI